MLKFNHGRFELEQLSFTIPDNLYLTSVGEMQIENGLAMRPRRTAGALPEAWPWLFEGPLCAEKGE